MPYLLRNVIILFALAVLSGCMYDQGAPDTRTPVEKWAHTSKEEFVDKDTHMKKFYEGKISVREAEIDKKTKDLEKLNKNKPTKWEDVLHDEMKKDRLENEISEAKKSKRNWEKLLNDHIKEREGGGDSDGGGSSGGC
ncbi:hypothetical protein [uncultured Pseudodesulfovibrio sp.]|uniref:hypothetical protein n=1 Tax=uncultured Pseudodesulfovibrio sp. TaxID=2035858 RepID=UPI0029C7F337|nr:hypothetical protein [uncultured Pseudodesulfovibrio sp.]